MIISLHDKLTFITSPQAGAPTSPYNKGREVLR